MTDEFLRLCEYELRVVIDDQQVVAMSRILLDVGKVMLSIVVLSVNLLAHHVKNMHQIKSRTCSSCTSVTRTLSTNTRRHTTMANVRSVPGRTMTGGCRKRKLVCSVIWRVRQLNRSYVRTAMTVAARNVVRVTFTVFLLGSCVSSAKWQCYHIRYCC